VTRANQRRKQPPEHRRIRRRVGWALVAVGALTLVYMIASHVFDWPKLAGAMVPALGVGLAIIVGPLSTTRAMTWLIALWLTIAVGVAIVLPLVQPWAITRAVYQASPVATVVWVIYHLIFIAFLGWAYRTLRRPAVCDAMRARGVRPATPWVAVGLGVLGVLGWAALEVQMTYSADARTVRAEAKLQHGVDRAYEVVRMHVDGGQGAARVKAYGNEGVEELMIAWGAPSAVMESFNPNDGDCGNGEPKPQRC